jgi:uncharacterized protein YbjQ (UPF0145 family)
MQALLQIIIFVGLIFVGYLAGRTNENRHYKKIRAEEIRFQNLPVFPTAPSEVMEKAQGGVLVTGNVVIAMDYFKRIAGALRKLFGGRIQVYETLLDRARREAILRMKKHAVQARGKVIVNMRLETSTIGTTQRNKNSGSIEVLAYGTALWWP